MEYGILAGSAEVISEMLWGGITKGVNMTGFSKGLTSLDDDVAKWAGSKIKNRIVKNLAEYGVKATFEGLEEVASGLGQAFAQKLTYKKDADFEALLKDQNLFRSFVMGAAISAFTQAPDVHRANKTKTDFVTGLTADEQTVVDKEIEKRVAEDKEQNPNRSKLKTNKAEKRIRDEVMSDLERGRIGIDTIEEALGGDDYTAYNDKQSELRKLKEEYVKAYDEYKRLYETKAAEKSDADTDRQDELKTQIEGIKAQIEAIESDNSLKDTLNANVFEKAKNTRLAESYNQREMRRANFTADLSQYDEKQRATVQRAMDSGILNNTNRTHDFVNMLAKLEADKGVPFNFADNEALAKSGFAVQNATINGYVNADGITVNINSSKALNSVVGHEISHILDESGMYEDFAKAITEYADTKGELESRRVKLTELYKDVKDANVEKELVADLVGDYLFTDTDFVNGLYSGNRGLFDKIYNEIKYLCKVATAGSKEARQLEKVKHTFEEMYRTTEAKTGEGAKYDIGILDNGNTYVIASRKVINGSDTKTMRSEISQFFDVLLEHNKSIEITALNGDVLTITQSESAKKSRDNYKKVNGNSVKMSDSEFKVKVQAEAHIDELVETSFLKNSQRTSDEKGHSFARDGFTYRTAYFEDFDGKYYKIILSIGHNGDVATVYNVTPIKNNGVPTSAKLIAVMGSKPLGTPSNNKVSQNTPVVNTNSTQNSRNNSSNGETFSLSDATEHKFILTQQTIDNIQNIGRISVNNFSSVDIEKTKWLAKKCYKEIGVKSPYFRAWFGDWRAYDTTPIQVAHKKSDSRGLSHNKDTGWNIQVSSKVFNETKAHLGNKNQKALQFLPYINDIVENAVLLDSYGIDKNKNKSNNSLIMHSFYAVADIGNGEEILKLYVEEMNNPNSDDTSKRAYQLQDVKKVPNASVRVQGTSPSSVTNTLSTLQTIADLFESVKSFDKNFRPNEVDKELLNDDGTPKVVYHGTPSQKFNVFKRNLNWFSDNKAVAETYKGTNGTEIACYLQMEKPMVVNANGEVWSKISVNNVSIEGIYDVKDFLDRYGASTWKEHGKLCTSTADIASAVAEAIDEGELDCDGLIINDVCDEGSGAGKVGTILGTDYVVFKPTQIKSATDTVCCQRHSLAHIFCLG